MKRRDRLVVGGALAVVAGAPFLLTMCSPAKPQSSQTATATATADAEAPPDLVTTSLASVASSAPLPPPVTPTAAEEPPEPPPYTGPVPGNCAAIERAFGTARTLTCKVDADCTTYGGYCMCPYPAARSSIPKLRALGEAFDKQRCSMKGTPRPCPSCALPPTPRCAAGKCS